MKCYNQLLQNPAYVDQRHVSGFPTSEVNADSLKIDHGFGRSSISHTDETGARVREVIRAT